jgi:hypothetical protein
MKKHYLLNITILITLSTFISCKKEPGEGGSGTIKGVLYAKNTANKDATLASDDYEPDQKIYISYGNKETYDDDYNTSANGSFEFKYLRPGTYKLFTYSTNPETYADQVVSKTVNIDKNGQTVTVNDFVIYKEADKGGEANIKGRIWVKNWDADWTYVKAEYPGAGEDVYIVYGDGSFYNDHIKASYDGTFEFKGLRKGTYKVFAYGDDKNSPSTEKEFLVTTSITSREQTVTLPDIVITK